VIVSGGGRVDQGDGIVRSARAHGDDSRERDEAGMKTWRIDRLDCCWSTTAGATGSAWWCAACAFYSDFEYEFKWRDNRKLDPEIETTS
jgi:hypothetical protein